MEHAVRDAHTHFFSRVFFDTLARQAPGDRAPDERLADLAKRTGIEVPDSDHGALQMRWIQEMEAAGIESMVVFASVPEEAEVVAEACATSGGRLTGYVVVNPLAAGAAALAERALGELGLRGLVLFPAMHHFELSDPACRPVLAAAAAGRSVVVCHTGLLKVKLRDLLGLPRSYDARYASPLGLVRAASEHPEVPFVLPHFGGGMFREALLAAAWCENVHFDTSSSNDWMAAAERNLTLGEVLGRSLEVLGPSRVLFGTDSSTFPRGYRKDILAALMEELDRLGVGDADRAAVLGGNLERLLATA